MQVLEMEEVEGLVRKKLPSRNNKQNKTGGFQVALQRNFVVYIAGIAGFLLLVLLLVSVQDTEEIQHQEGLDANIYQPAAAPTPAEDIPLSPQSDVVVPSPPTEPPQQQAAPEVPSPTAPPPQPQSVVETTPKDDAANDGTFAKNLYSKIATFKPLVDPPLPDKETMQELAQKWGKWGFWDGDEDMRPKNDYLSQYPNMDCPGDKLPDDAWQVDAVFVNHYLNDADKLISRAMDAIFAEYGHPREGLEPEQLAQRMQQFHWDKVDLSAEDASPPPKYQRRGDRGNGGWTTKRSQKGLERRLLHAMMTSDTFTVVMGGHSAAAGEGNHFRQSYMMQFHKIMAPIFARLGVKLITRNVAMGGLGTIQHAMGSGSIYGNEIDLLLWDSGMTEGRNLQATDLFLRQGLIGGNRVPVIWGNGFNFDMVKYLHENADADIGEFGQATDGLPEAQSDEHAKTIPWAARYMKCNENANTVCQSEPRFCARCWVDREDGITPPEPQLRSPRGQTSWHPGWRSHQLTGRNLAMAVLQSLQNAINLWNEHVSAGPPLADEFWHVTGYYENIRTKAMNLDVGVGPCYEWEGPLPTRMCRTPMKGMTHYTPRANPEKTGINAYVKPTPDGYIPTNQKKNLFDGPEPPNPCYQIPEGEVNVYAIVSGRRLLNDNVTSDHSNQEVESYTTSMAPPSWHYYSNRSLETGDIVPGKGWQLIAEPQGYCDGTYNAECFRWGDCVLQGHHAGRGAILGNEFSGWLVVTLPALKEGIIVIKIHTWHYASENTITDGWTTVNNERLLLRRDKGPVNLPHEDSFLDESDVEDVTDETPRLLGVRSTDTPEQPDTMIFEYAVDGKITSLPRDEFLEKRKKIDRVVEVLTVLDDPNYTTEPKDVEIAIRMRGCGKQCNFALSHVYWA